MESIFPCPACTYPIRVNSAPISAKCPRCDRTHFETAAMQAQLHPTTWVEEAAAANKVIRERAARRRKCRTETATRLFP